MSNTNTNRIKNLSYSEIVGIVKERNRPSGGIKTVHEVGVNTFLTSQSNVLEIGSNTGFTSVNISLLTGCNVVGIDMVDASIKEATAYAKLQHVSNKVSFQKTNALALPFDMNVFDLVWASNVTSFINDKARALEEYARVLKQGGYLAFIPIYYIKTPPQDLVKKVSGAIGAEITIREKNEWKQLVDETQSQDESKLQLIYEKNYKYLDQSDILTDYINMILNKCDLSEYSKDEINTINERYTYFMRLFNENLSYCGYSTLIYQKRKTIDEMELFLSIES